MRRICVSSAKSSHHRSSSFSIFRRPRHRPFSKSGGITCRTIVTHQPDVAPTRVGGLVHLQLSGPSMTPASGLFCLLTGLLLMLIFPWYDVEWLAWIAFVPLLTTTRGVRLRTALVWGWISGCVGYLGILRWIPHTMINFGGVPTPVSYGIFLLL